jgi:hypothetical protein
MSLWSTWVSTRPLMGSQKLGQPVPLSNFVRDSNNGSAHAAQTYVPLRFSSFNGLVYGRSVPSLAQHVELRRGQQNPPFVRGLHDLADERGGRIGRERPCSDARGKRRGGKIQELTAIHGGLRYQSYNIGRRRPGGLTTATAGEAGRCSTRVLRDFRHRQLPAIWPLALTGLAPDLPATGTGTGGISPVSSQWRTRSASPAACSGPPNRAAR